LGETKFVLKAMAASMIVNVSLGYLLLQSLGWLGPALSAVCSGYLLAALIMLEMHNQLGVGFERLMPWRALARVSSVAMLAAAASLPVVLLSIGSIWKLAAGFVIYATIYLVGNLKTNAITRSDLETLQSWVWITSRSVLGKGVLENGTRK
jgi:hypothetical protein